ncbi:MAG TPA: tetratricopeptide repeat protein [Phycisphaerae bacterium]|nr:tetratricopeptide repeat protein [Phycisphaerae bacterium]
MTYRRFFSAVFVCLLASGCSLFDPKTKTESADAERKRPASPDAAAQPAAPRISPLTHLAAGQMLERQGDLQGAIEQYEKAISINPRFTTAWNRLAIVYQKQGKFADAEQVFQQGIRADPGAAMLRNNLGYIYLTQNRLDQAEIQCREALQISPEFKRARMNLAVTLAHMGRPQESLIEFSHVVSADMAHYNLGVISLNLKDYALAERSFRQALSINPDCPGAKECLERASRLARGGPGQPVGPPLPSDASLAGQIGAEGANQQ